MRKRPFIIAGMTLITGILIFNFYFQKVRQGPETYILNTIYNIGFPQIEIESTEKHAGTIILKNIKLDPEGFSTIGEIQITSNWFPYFGAPPIQNVLISDIELSGELDKNYTLSIAGLTEFNFKSSLVEKILLNAEKIKIENMRLSLLSESLGGIDIRIEAGLRKTDETSTQLSIDFLTQQRALALNIYASGAIEQENGAWEIQMQTEQGRLDSETVSIKRLYGQIVTAGHNWQPQYTSGQLTAGQVMFYGNDAQNVSATLEQKDKNFKLIAEGKSAQPSAKDSAPLELGLLYSNTKPETMQITIFTPDTQTLLDYFGISKAKALTYEIWPTIRNLENYNILLPWPLTRPEEKTAFERPFLITNNATAQRILGTAYFASEKEGSFFSLENAKEKQN